MSTFAGESTMKRGRVQSEPTPARRSARTAATEAAPAQTPIAKRSTRKPSAIALESGAATPPESEPTPHTLVDAPPVAVAPPARGAAAARKGVVGTPTRAVAPALASAAPARSPAAARTAPPAEPAVPKVGEDGLTPYERERLQNLERNRLKMEELGLIGTAMEMAVRQPSAPPPKARGLQPARKKAPVEDVGPARRSLRGQGKTADNRFAAGVHDESADGTVIVMVAGEAIRYKPNMRTDGGAAEAERLARTALASADAPFVSIDSSRRKADADDGVKRAATDAAFIALLASAACSAPAQRADELAAPPSAAPPLSGLLGLGLRDGHVAKVCPRDIVHVAFQPRADSLVLTAADKGGHVAIWDVRRAEASAARAAKAEEAAEAAEASGAPAAAAADDDDDDDDDGVLLLKPHQQYVSGLRWSPGRPSRLFTASYDGTVRCLDLGHAGGSGGGASAFSLVHHSDEHEISAFEVDQAGNVAFFADNRGAREAMLRAGGARPLCAPQLGSPRARRACDPARLRSSPPAPARAAASCAQAASASSTCAPRASRSARRAPRSRCTTRR
jgi:hypothetical protein